MVRCRRWVSFVLLVFASGLALAQKKQDLLANFTGPVTSITKSDIAIQGDGDNALVFSVSHRTKFFRNSKPVSRNDIRPGDVVTIQSGEDPTGHPSAITVTVAPAAAPSRPAQLSR